jgi:MoaA/NifB/PqqE/SkfB family radical SAM enzyme
LCPHGTYRPKNSFKPAVNGFRRIAKCNPKTGLKTVIHERNIHCLRGLLDLALDSGANHFTYNILRNLGRAAKVQLPRIDEETVFRELLNIVEKDKKYLPILKGSPFGNVIMSTHTQNFIFVNRLGIYVDPRARIYPHGDLTFDDFLLWDLRQQNLKLFNIDRLYQLRRRYDFANQNCCRNCLGYKFCFGGDLGTHYIHYGTIKGEFFNCEELRNSIVSAMLINDEDLIERIAETYISDI